MANMLTWTAEYSVDIQEIDEQHKRLVDLINRLYEAIAAKDQAAVIEQVLDELVDYTRVHFAVEECLMRMFGYPDYEAHKAVHDKIVERVMEFQTKFKGGDQKMGMELLYFLKDWLMDHIQKVDRQYAPHLTKSGVKKTWLKKFF